MYSLVSAPVLGFDLTRLDGGAATAAVLERALWFTSDDLPALARALPADEVRARLWRDIDAAIQLRPALRGLADTPLSGALAVLEAAPIGSADALLRCVRQDVFDWTWCKDDTTWLQEDEAARATAVVCDAVMAAYLRELLPADTRRRLAVGWLLASRALGAPRIERSPRDTAVTALCERLRTLGAAGLERLRAAADRARSDAVSWSQAVHAATWAVHTADRVRAAADAQLRLVQAVDAADIPLSDRAGGVWNLLSGAVQVLTVADLVDDELAARLLDPCVAALGLPVPGRP
ncbi:hypothetical protein [Actinomadura hibisca]|uniref:hypothetical protein n=1 Tax=Actinomadura hibisca TaxID=68565 RepID=UPI00082C61A4|nr:hypothetical protein [Actinomadura hibisca]